MRWFSSIITMMNDSEFMKIALYLAGLAAKEGEVPVGAVVVKDDIIIGRGFNHREKDNDITSHAEIEAIKQASRMLGSWRLSGCTLYVTLEPCLMCSGAILQSRLQRVVYGADDPKDGAVVSRYHVFDDPSLHERPLIERGVLAEESKAILSTFFEGKR